MDKMNSITLHVDLNKVDMAHVNEYEGGRYITFTVVHFPDSQYGKPFAVNQWWPGQEKEARQKVGSGKWLGGEPAPAKAPDAKYPPNSESPF